MTRKSGTIQYAGGEKNSSLHKISTSKFRWLIVSLCLSSSMEYCIPLSVRQPVSHLLFASRKASPSNCKMAPVQILTLGAIDIAGFLVDGALGISRGFGHTELSH